MDEFDWEALLAPISEEAPVGNDPRANFAADSLYFRLRDARTEARAAERQADAAGEESASAAPWGPVLRLAVKLLATEAKDLEVAAWCSEALLRADGLAGLAAGFALMQELVERYGEALHPEPDEEGIARHVAPVMGLNGESAEGTLIQPLRKLALFQRPDGTPLPFWRYQQSVETAGIGDIARREQRFAAGVIPFDQIEKEADAASGAAFARLHQEATAALNAWQGLSRALDLRAGNDAPPMGRVRDLLSEIVAIAARYAPENEIAAAAATEGATPIMEPSALESGDGGTIRTREEALRRLNEIAEFFRRTEPHSPLAYTLFEAVRRGRLSWPQLLEEIVPDPDSRAGILRSLGIQPSPTSE